MDDIVGDEAAGILAAEIAKGPGAENVYANRLPIPFAFRRRMERQPDKWADHLAADLKWRQENDAVVPTLYDIKIDQTRLVTQDDVHGMLMATAAFGMWREAEQALMALTLALGQGKITMEEASRRLQPLLDGAKADAG